MLRASGLALLTLCPGGGGLSFTDPSLVYWSWAQALGLQPPHPSALSRLGWPLPRLPSQPLALNLSPGWAGSGRAWDPGQRVLGWAIPSFGRGSPPPSMGQGRDLLALQVPGCGGGRFEDLMGCPPPASPTIPHFVPSRGPGAQPGLAGAAATVQCVGQWAVEPDVGVGEGGADGIRCVGRGVVGGSWLRKGLDGNASNSRDWPGVRFGVSPVS